MDKESSAKAAWITGGFALAGTVLTLLFSGPLDPYRDRTPPPRDVSATFSLPASTDSVVPAGVEGQWVGGAQGMTNLRLTITRDASYSLLDTEKPGLNAGEGKLEFDGATVTFYDIDTSTMSLPWSIEKTPIGDVLHIGTAFYRRA